MIMYECFNSYPNNSGIMFDLRPLNRNNVVNYIDINKKSSFASLDEYYDF